MERKLDPFHCIMYFGHQVNLDYPIKVNILQKISNFLFIPSPNGVMALERTRASLSTSLNALQTKHYLSMHSQTQYSSKEYTSCGKFCCISRQNCNDNWLSSSDGKAALDRTLTAANMAFSIIMSRVWNLINGCVCDKNSFHKIER